MTSRGEFLTVAKLDASNFDSGIQQMIAQLQRLATQFANLGETGRVRKVESLIGRAEDLKVQQAAVENLTRRLERLRDLRASLEGRKSIGISPEDQALLGGIGGKARRLTEGTLMAEGHRTSVALKAQQLKLEEEILAVQRRQEASTERANQLQRQRAAFQAQVSDVVSGQQEARAQAQRLNALEDQRRALERQRAILQGQVTQAVGARPGARLDRELLPLQEKLNAARRDEQRIVDSLVVANRILSEATTTRDREVAVRRINRLLEEQRLAVQRVESTTERLNNVRGAPAARLASATEASGASEELARIETDLAENARQQTEVYLNGLQNIVPEYANVQKRIEAINKELQAGNIPQQRQNELLREQAALLVRSKELTEEAATTGIQPTLDPEAFRQQQIAQLQGMERLFVQAFDDIGRRFTATLQFAISGALIFGVQQFVREFAEAAIDVERTFADIASALEFDLADEGLARGTGAFNRRVEEFRRGVVDLSNEFNVLPEVANKAAFQMSARFSDTGQALLAVRAQLLATKVATIDQSEALRALTATAEGFADAVLTSDSSLSFEERLLVRASEAARGYGAALDEAVFIQQRFGIEVEDTLEGTARAAETFRQLGFSRQETEATVAAVSFQLGQTGTNVAERLNRAFGGITQPEVRDALLELAAASDAFQLSLSDFDSGAGAIKRIDDQIRRLQEVEPQTALGIRDILGQRRETEVVAAFFGTADLRRSIEQSLSGAAGAAERRFGFLAATVSEQIQSILVQFQELAQNFERIGGLTPFKLVLGGAELFLNIMNEVLLTVESIFGWFDSLGDLIGVDIGEGLRTILSIALALHVTMKGIAAASTAIAFANASLAGLEKVAATAGVVGATGAVAGGAVAAGTTQKVVQALGPLGVHLVGLGNQLKTTTGFFARLQVLAAGLVTGIGAAIRAIHVFAANLLARGLGGRFADAAGAATGLARFASGAILAAGAAVLFADRLRRASDDASAAIAGVASAQDQARTQTRLQDLTTPFANAAEFEAFRAQAELDLLAAAAQESVRGGWETGFIQNFPIFDRETREAVGGFGSALAHSLAGLLGRQLFAEVGIPGFHEVEARVVANSQQFWDDRIRQADEAFIRAQIEAMTLRVADLPTVAPPTRKPQGRFAPAPPAQIELTRQLALAGRELEEATLPEERQAIRDRIAALEITLQELEAEVGSSMEALEGTLKGIQDRLAAIPSRVALGQVQPAAVPGLIAKEIENLKKQRQLILDTKPQDMAALLQQVDQDIVDANLAYLDGVGAAFERRLRIAQEISDPATSLAAQLSIMRQQFAQIPEELRNSQFALGILDEIAATQKQTAVVAAEAAVSAAERRVALAQTTAEWVAAMRALQEALDAVPIAEMQAQIESLDPADRARFPQLQTRPDTEAQREADQRQAEIDIEVADRLLQEAARRASAQVRLAGPIRSRVAQINAEIAGLQVIIASGTLDIVDALESQVRMQELLADRVEAQQNAVAAYIRLQAGVGDSIKGLQAELVILAEQLKTTAELYGKQSEEYFGLQLAQERLRSELVQATLRLEDLKRRLGSDITNDFQQAQLDLVEIMRALANAGDLGELEKAELELKRRQAEAAAEKAFFDDRLFQLRFAFETGALSLTSYRAALQRLLESVDTSTQQGKETFLQIQALIDGLAGDISDLSFNIPTAIRLPTLFEVRRALAADQMGVNYMDNRQVNVTVDVSSVIELEQVLQAIDDAFGEGTAYEYRRSATGRAGIYAGGF